MWARSGATRALCAKWLFDTRHAGAQALRLRIGIERDAFQQMTTAWKHLGFPFERLVPSYATAIGASGDRPVALAELMGTIVANGVRRPTRDVGQLVFGENTPYHTALEPTPQRGERVMSPAIAHTLRQVLGDVLWGDLDYLIVDLPPGTGDASMSLAQLIPISGVVVVMTPQDVAWTIANKAVDMFRQLEAAGTNPIPILGVVENMSGFVCPKCGEETALFNKGGGR